MRQDTGPGHPRPILVGGLTFNANNLAQGVRDFHQILLGFHNRVDVLVSRRGFIDHILVLATLHTFGGFDMIIHRKTPLGFGPGHRSARAVTATVETVLVAQAADWQQ